MDTNKKTATYLASFLMSLILVTGCTPDSGRWTPAEAPKENKIDFVTLQHQVHFAPGSSTITTAETKSLAEFLRTVDFAYGDEATIDIGPRGGSAAADALASKRLDAVAVALRRQRVHAQPATKPTVEGVLSRDTAIVTIGRYVVTPPNCPDRRKPEADDYTNNTESNYGCATATNLGLMVANPGDLVRGATPGPADGDFATRGVQLYRAGGMQKSLPALTTTGGGQ